MSHPKKTKTPTPAAMKPASVTRAPAASSPITSGPDSSTSTVAHLSPSGSQTATPAQGTQDGSTTAGSPATAPGTAAQAAPTLVKLSGKLAYPEGITVSPAPCVEVDADGGCVTNFQWLTDDSFSFCVPSGTRVCVSYPSTVGATGELVRKGAGLIELQATAECDLPTVTYESAAGLITGTIVAETIPATGGKICLAPLPGVPVGIADSNGKPVASAGSTDSRGMFQIPNPGHDVILSLPTEFPSPSGQSPLVLENNLIHLVLCSKKPFEICPISYHLARSELIVQVTNGTTGLEGARVSLMPQRGSCTLPQEGCTDAYGNCYFRDLIPGQVTVSVASTFRDSLHKKWELPTGTLNKQGVPLVGRNSQTVSFTFQEEQFLINWTVTSDSAPAEGILVEVRDADGHRVIDRQRTNQSGVVNFNVGHEGDFEVRVYDDERVTAQPLRYERVSVHSTARGACDIANQAS
jgi:hypothetical protein